MATGVSCDTFVVLPNHTQNGVVFGKNSDRPRGEVQEIVYYPATRSSNPIKCTYIEVESSESTKAVILSKPSWMWGAEMGSNECGVAIGNEAIWTKEMEDVGEKKLLGMDLVRLGLERSSNATEALEVITSLLEKYGQGGPCSNTDTDFCYFNSFLIADPYTAWVLETSGKHWIAEHITSGYRNISNNLSITTKFDRTSEGLKEYAKSKGLWDGVEEFNFSKVFGGDGDIGDRHKAGIKLLENNTTSNNFRETDMFTILRNTESGICRSCSDPFPTQSSQVSTLTVNKPSVHWFTGTPDTSKSVFKPFIFTPNAVISKHTQCAQDSAPHNLYKLHSEAMKKGTDVLTLLRNMEEDCVKELEKLTESIGDDLSEVDDLLKDCVETEIKFYR